MVSSIVALPLPTTLSPSKITSFTNCPLAFRFSVIEKLPEPPAPAAMKGTLVHRALELLFADYPIGSRSRAAAKAGLDAAWEEMRNGTELDGLGLDEVGRSAFLADALTLVEHYFDLEDPNSVHVVGLEQHMSTNLEGVIVRGIIDRLDEQDDGTLAVVDYKTGRAPRSEQSGSRLGGVQMYALMCEAELSRRPAVVRLMYLRDRVVISAVPTDQAMRGTRQRALGVWAAIERACRLDAFQPNPSKLCDYCSFKPYCPSFGGDPALAAATLGSPIVAAPEQSTATPGLGEGGTGPTSPLQ
ncbi:MAG: PD-(D/E)XK nuclease family protein [Acidimicrobiales bacterium]|jgi:putative RecB family exonuclease